MGGQRGTNNSTPHNCHMPPSAIHHPLPISPQTIPLHSTRRWKKENTLDGQSASSSSEYVFLPEVTLGVSARELQSLTSEVWCLFVRWYDQFLLDEISLREIQDLRILDAEFHEVSSE